jgi:hypothetical protein
MKFRLEFITSQFVTARFRVTHWPSPTLPVSIEDYAGDAVSQIIDVRGDTIMDLTIPYMSPYPYQRCCGYIHANEDTGWTGLPSEDQNSFLTVSLVNMLQQPDFAGTAQIYLNVYVAAASDFVFGSARSPTIRTPLNTTVAVRDKIVPHSLEVAFKGSFPPIVSASGTYEAGLILPEQYTGLEELCMRYSAFGFGSTADVVPLIAQYDLVTGVLQDGTDHLVFWGKCYRWNRGGLRYKHVLVTTVLGTSDRISYVSLNSTDGGGANAYAPIDHNQRSVIEYEVPWVLGTYANSYWDVLAQDRYVNTAPVDIVFVYPGSGVRTNLLNWRAAADDYTFGHQLAVPTYAFTPPLPVVPDSEEKARGRLLLAHTQEPKLDQSFGLPDAVREKLVQYLITKDKSSAH